MQSDKSYLKFLKRIVSKILKYNKKKLSKSRRWYLINTSELYTSISFFLIITEICLLFFLILDFQVYYLVFFFVVFFKFTSLFYKKGAIEFQLAKDIEEERKSNLYSLYSGALSSFSLLFLPFFLPHGLHEKFGFIILSFSLVVLIQNLMILYVVKANFRVFFNSFYISCVEVLETLQILIAVSYLFGYFFPNAPTLYIIISLTIPVLIYTYFIAVKKTIYCKLKILSLVNPTIIERLIDHEIKKKAKTHKDQRDALKHYDKTASRIGYHDALTEIHNKTKNKNKRLIFIYKLMAYAISWIVLQTLSALYGALAQDLFLEKIKLFCCEYTGLFC